MTLLLLLDDTSMSPVFTHGSKAKLLWGAHDVSPFFRSASVDVSRDTAETTAFQNSSKTYIPGLIDATLSAEGMFDSTTLPAGSDEILEAALASESKIDIALYPDGDALGSVGFAVHADQTAYAITSPVDDIVAVSAEAQSSVGAERVLSLHPLGEETATGNGTGVDNGVSTPDGAVAYLHVTDVTAGSVAVKVQHSTDNTAWVDLITFATATVPGSQRVKVAGTVNRYLRTIRTITTGPATYQVGASRTPLA